MLARVLTALAAVPNLRILGNPKTARVPVRLPLAASSPRTRRQRDMTLDRESSTIVVWVSEPVVPAFAHPDTIGVQILSFMVAHPTSASFLHWNFVATLLSDLFGIQSRGGCACAGPLGHALLGITPPAAAAMHAALLDKAEILRPGCVHMSACDHPY